MCTSTFIIHFSFVHYQHKQFFRFDIQNPWQFKQLIQLRYSLKIHLENLLLFNLDKFIFFFFLFSIPVPIYYNHYDRKSSLFIRHNTATDIRLNDKKQTASSRPRSNKHNDPGRTIQSVYGYFTAYEQTVYGAVLLYPILRTDTVHLRAISDRKRPYSVQLR